MIIPTRTYLDGVDVLYNLLTHVGHVGNGVCTDNEVPIRVPNELPQLVFLHLNILARLELDLRGVSDQCHVCAHHTHLQLFKRLSTSLISEMVFCSNKLSAFRMASLAVRPTP